MPSGDRRDNIKDVIAHDVVKREDHGLCCKPLYQCIRWYEGLREPIRSSRLAAVLHSHYFENTSSCVILTNSIYTAVAADYTMQHLDEPEPAWIMWCNLFFIVYYAVEVFIRLAVHHLYFFQNESCRWNIFDLSLVVISIVEFVIQETGGEESSGVSMSFVRLFRLLKFMRILRTLRVMRVFKDLAVLMSSFANGFMALFWCFIMLAFKLYIFALVFLTAMTNYIRDQGDALSEDEKDRIEQYYGSLGRSMTTLYMAVTGGDDWMNAYVVVKPAGDIYNILFLFFTFYFSFAVFNILTGVFVDKAIAAAQPDLEEILFQQRQRAAEQLEQLQDLVKYADKGSTGKVSRIEFLEMIKDETISSYLESIGVDVHQAETFFSLLQDADQSEDIDMRKFIEGILSMKGTAKSIDLQRNLYDTHHLRKHVNDLSKRMDQVADVSTRILDLLERKEGGTRSAVASPLASGAPGVKLLEQTHSCSIRAHVPAVPVTAAVAISPVGAEMTNVPSSLVGVKAELISVCEDICDQFTAMIVPKLLNNITVMLEQHASSNVASSSGGGFEGGSERNEAATASVYVASMEEISPEPDSTDCQCPGSARAFCTEPDQQVSRSANTQVSSEQDVGAATHEARGATNVGHTNVGQWTDGFG